MVLSWMGSPAILCSVSRAADAFGPVQSFVYPLILLYHTGNTPVNEFGLLCNLLHIPYNLLQNLYFLYTLLAFPCADCRHRPFWLAPGARPGYTDTK